MTDKINIKSLCSKDLVSLHDLIQGENWTPVSLDELQIWHSLYPDSFIGAFNAKGELIGKILFI